MLTRAVVYSACAVLFLLNVSQADSPNGLIKLGTDTLITVSNTGKTLAAWSPAHPASVRFVVTETGKRGATLRLEPETELLLLKFRRKDGYISAVTSDGRFLTWAGVKAPDVVELEGGVSKLGTFEISRSAKTLVYGGMPDEEGRVGSVWDLSTGERKHTFEGPAALLTAVSADDNRVFLISPEGVRYWDRESDEETQLSDFSSPVESAKRSRDGRYLMCLSRDRVWLVDTVDCEVDYIEGSAGMRASFDPTGERIVVGHGRDRDRKIEVWSLGNRLTDLAFEKEYRGLLAAPFGVGSSAIVYHARNDEETLQVEHLEGGEPTLVAYDSGLLRNSYGNYDSSATLIDMTESGNRVVLGLADGTLGVWTTEAVINGFAPQRNSRDPRVQMSRPGSRCLGLLSLPSPPTEATFLGDNGSMLIDLVDGDRYLAVGPVLFPPNSVATLRYRPWKSYARRKLNHVDFSPDGKLLAVALDDGLSIVNSRTGTEQEFYPHGCFLARFGSRGDKVFCVGSRQRGMADLRRRTYVPMDNLGDATRRLTGARLMTNFSLENRGILVEADTGRVVNSFEGDLIARPMQYGVSDNGKFFIMVGRARDRRKMHLEVFGVEDSKLIASMESQNVALMACHVLSDGQTAIIGSQRGAAFYDIRRRRLLRAIPDESYRDEKEKEQRERGYVGSVFNRRAVSTDLDSTFTLRGQSFNATAMDVNEAAGRVVLAEYSRVSIWDLHSGDLIWIGDVDQGKVASAALSPDGRTMAIGKESGEVHIQRINN